LSNKQDNKRLQLGEIAKISTGYTFRSRLEAEEGGTVAVLQIRDLSKEAMLAQPLLPGSEAELCRLLMDKRFERYLLQPGDVLFQSRGSPMFATVVPDGLGEVIAASPLMVLRPKAKLVDPMYLAWFLNHAPGQRQIQQMALGTSIQMLSQADLKELKVVLPPLAVQRQVAETALLQEQEQLLLQALVRKRQQYVDAVLVQRVKTFS
jgi:hypothetical protein